MAQSVRGERSQPVAQRRDKRGGWKGDAPGLSHLTFAELGEEASKESLAQGSMIEFAFHRVF